MKEKRGGVRTPIKTEVEITSELLGAVTAYTRELSDSGAFIESTTLTSLSIGSRVTIQAQGFPESMPLLDAEVVRTEKEGIALRFIL
ncbi:MAG: PilZ domain-containing protein [Kangiellaceae bacterium]|jgi:hypothetical protein|nr:PilZ domain-containing protein [Kangiellaceae bacterium]